MLAQSRERTIHPAVVVGDGVPTRLLNHHHAITRFPLGRRLRAAHVGGAPRGKLLGTDLRFEVGNLARREHLVLVVLAQQLDDPLVLLDDRAALRLSGEPSAFSSMLIENGLADVGSGAALLEERVEGSHEGGAATAPTLRSSTTPASARRFAFHERVLRKRKIGLAHEFAQQLRRPAAWPSPSSHSRHEGANCSVPFMVSISCGSSPTSAESRGAPSRWLPTSRDDGEEVCEEGARQSRVQARQRTSSASSFAPPLDSGAEPTASEELSVSFMSAAILSAALVLVRSSHPSLSGLIHCEQ